MTERQVDDNDYNQLRNPIVTILGVGNANRGYGQVVKSSQAEQGSTITAEQWQSLAEDLSNVVVHQTGSFPNIPILDQDSIIDLDDYNSLVSSAGLLDQNRFNVAVSRTVITSKGLVATTQPWALRAQTNLTVTFESSNNARYFFNSGGQIRLSSSRTGGGNSPQNGAWTNLLNSIGNINFDRESYYNLTNNYQLWFQQNLSTPYSSNFFRVEVSSDAPANIAGVAKIINFRITWEDPYSGPSDRVDGTLSLEVNQIKATGVLADGSNFTIEDPRYVLDPIGLLGTPVKFYNLSVSKNSANAGNDTFTVVLTTFNVPDGEVVPYTISGVASSEINNVPLTGSFTVINNSASQTFRTTSSEYITVPVPVSVPVPISVNPPAPTIPPEPPVPSNRIELTSISGTDRFIVPSGVTRIRVTLIGGGAGGSSGSEADPWWSGGGGGGSGGILTQVLSVTPGQSISYRIGQGGLGTSGGSAGGTQGSPGGETRFGTINVVGGRPATSNLNSGHFNVGGQAGPGGSNGSDGQSRRGESSSFNLMTGGQGGGVPGYSTGGQGGPTPSKVDFSVNSRQIPGAVPVTYPAWNDTMNQYAAWSPNQQEQTVDVSTVVDFPFTGNYTFYLQTDNRGSISIDGSVVVSATDNFRTNYVSQVRRVTAGSHTIRLIGENFGAWTPSNPAGIAALITGSGTVASNNGNGFRGNGPGAGGGGGSGGKNDSAQGNGAEGNNGLIIVEYGPNIG